MQIDYIDYQLQSTGAVAFMRNWSRITMVDWDTINEWYKE
jgi:hypothetical protein